MHMHCTYEHGGCLLSMTMGMTLTLTLTLTLTVTLTTTVTLTLTLTLTLQVPTAAPTPVSACTIAANSDRDCVPLLSSACPDWSLCPAT